MPTIRKRNGRFQAQVRVKQHGEIVHEQSATFDTEKQALQWGYGIEDQWSKGLIVSKQSAKTVADIVEAHRQALIDAEKDTRGFEHSFNALIDSKLGKMQALKVEAGDIVEWGKEYSKPPSPSKPRSPATVLHALMALRSCYSTARSEMKIKVDVQEVADAINHLNRLGIAGKSTERDRRVSDAEVDVICKYHESMEGTTIPLRKCMTLAIALPRRKGELFNGMMWEHYDGETVKLFDTKDPTKVRNEVVPIPPKAKAIIDSMPRSKGFIMPYNPGSVGTAIYRICQLIGIKDLHWHDLRHEGVSRLFEAGLDIPRVAMISGHQSWATLRRYTHLKPGDVVSRMEELAKASALHKEKSPAMPG